MTTAVVINRESNLRKSDRSPAFLFSAANSLKSSALFDVATTISEIEFDFFSSSNDMLGRKSTDEVLN